MEIRQRHNLPPEQAVGIGVERMDYTKGIEERLRAVERLLEIEPQWIGKFTFIQIAAPTRIHIEEYRAYEARVRELATRINQRFPEALHPPVILKIEHHQPEQIFEYYRGADLCMVTSLHDGMNLVAKEFVSARDDERGVLILSLFTGAAAGLGLLLRSGRHAHRFRRDARGSPRQRGGPRAARALVSQHRWRRRTHERTPHCRD